MQGEAGALHAFPLLLGAVAVPESRNQGGGEARDQRQAKEVAEQQKLAEEVHPREVAEEAALARSFKMCSSKEERRQPRSCQNENQMNVVTFNSSTHLNTGTRHSLFK